MNKFMAMLMIFLVCITSYAYCDDIKQSTTVNQVAAASNACEQFNTLNILSVNKQECTNVLADNNNIKNSAIGNAVFSRKVLDIKQDTTVNQIATASNTCKQLNTLNILSKNEQECTNILIGNNNIKDSAIGNAVFGRKILDIKQDTTVNQVAAASNACEQFNTLNILSVNKQECTNVLADNNNIKNSAIGNAVFGRKVLDIKQDTTVNQVATASNTCKQLNTLNILSKNEQECTNILIGNNNIKNSAIGNAVF